MVIGIQTEGGPATGDANRRKAVRYRCLDCSASSPSAVEKCPHADCPMFVHRMMAGKQDAADRSEAIRTYCLWCVAGQPMQVARCHIKTCPLFAYRNTKVDESVQMLCE
jgi:hypothetical protein